VPLLPLESFLFPVNLLDQPSCGGDSSAPWYVLHTRPRAEKALARKLLERNLPFFLPLNKRQWRSQGRLLCSYVPLFPGYVFLRGDRAVVLKTQETNLVARVLEVDDQEQLHSDLRRVYCLMTSGVPITPEDRLKPGVLVEITSGALAGLEGRVLRRGKQLKLVIEVRFLQQGVSVEVESWMIQPRSERPALENAGK
jgi:transcription antitermination factor NusG